MTKQKKDKCKNSSVAQKTTGLIEILLKDHKSTQSQAFKDVFQYLNLPNTTEKISV